MLRFGGVFFFGFWNWCYRGSRRRLVLPFERLPQPELDLGAQRTHLLPRLNGQRLAQVVLEADREALILVRVVSHRDPLVAGATPSPPNYIGRSLRNVVGKIL